MTPSKRSADAGALDQQTPTPRKRINARSVSAATDKIMKEQMSSLSITSREILEKNGFTCRGRIEDDVERKRRGEHLVMGKHYYEKLRLIYGGEDSAISKIKARIINRDQPLEDGLDGALSALHNHHRDYNPIIGWMQMLPDDATINHISICSIYSHLLANAGNHPRSLEFQMETMKMISRFSLDQTYAREFQIIMPHLDDMLRIHYERAARNGVVPSTWWNGHRDQASLILDAASMDTILSHQPGARWITIEAQLTRINGSGSCGALIVNVAWMALMSDKSSKLLDDYVQKIMGVDITEDLVNTTKNDFIASMRVANIDPMSPMPGNATEITYRGTGFPIPCRSKLDGFIKKMFAHIYAINVENGSLAEIWEEGSLIEGDPSLKGLKTDAALIRQQAAARDAAIQCMQAVITRSEDMTADVLKGVMNANREILLSIDPNWEIVDQLFKTILGEGSAARFNELIYRCLPSTSSMIDPAEASRRMHALACSKAMGMMGYSNIATCRAYICTIEQIQKSQRAEMANDGSTHQKMISAKMALWLEAKKEDGTMVRGRAAANVLIQQMNAKNDDDLTLDDVKDLNTFAWLLDQATIEKIDDVKARLIGDRALVVQDLASDRASGTSRGSRDLALAYV
jgi:hypothetical protein